MEVVDTTYAKTHSYQKTLESIKKEGLCPFCPRNFVHHKKPILRKLRGWMITENNWPYKKSAYHFLVIGPRHKTEFSELDVRDMESVMRLINWTIKRFKILGGAVMLRFGHTSLTGATVCHLHFHFIVPKINQRTKRALTVQFPIG